MTKNARGLPQIHYVTQPGWERERAISERFFRKQTKLLMGQSVVVNDGPHLLLTSIAWLCLIFLWQSIFAGEFYGFTNVLKESQLQTLGPCLSWAKLTEQCYVFNRIHNKNKIAMKSCFKTLAFRVNFKP